MSSDRCAAKKRDLNNCENNNTLVLDVTVDINDICDGALQVIKRIRPLWKINDIKFKVFTAGYTNKLVGCFESPAAFDADNVTLAERDVILVRIYGKNTEVLIDRNKEIRNFKLLHSYGFAPRLLATFKNGLAYEFCSGEQLSKEKMHEENVWKLIAKRMAELHRDVKGVEKEPKPMLKTKLFEFLDLVPKTFSDSAKQKSRETLLPSLDEVRSEVERLFAVYDEIDSPVVFAHNDLLLGNILYDESEKKVTFIDYEYADFNYQAYDIGNHFDEFAGMVDIDYSLYPSEEFQMEWLRVYLNAYHQNDNVVVNDELVQKLYVAVNKFALAAHLFWLLWAYNQAEYSPIDYDYIGFAALRYKEYLTKRDAFLSLQ